LPRSPSYRHAAARGAEITSQLLTFARRQPLEPREIDVNGLVVAQPVAISICSPRS